MSESGEVDFNAWAALRERQRVDVEQVKRRMDIRGATRPARDPDEAAFLRETGQESPFEEVERPGWREWLDYTAMPLERRSPPGLTAADFARPFLEAERSRRAIEMAAGG
jgi:hypothetical protein